MLHYQGTVVPRSEDGLIAWTWREFMEMDEEEEDPDILARFPMCKVSLYRKCSPQEKLYTVIATNPNPPYLTQP